MISFQVYLNFKIFSSVICSISESLINLKYFYIDLYYLILRTHEQMVKSKMADFMLSNDVIVIRNHPFL